MERSAEYVGSLDMDDCSCNAAQLSRVNKTKYKRARLSQCECGSCDALQLEANDAACHSSSALYINDAHTKVEVGQPMLLSHSVLR